jgi:class 3 adenylate cyclase
MSILINRKKLVFDLVAIFLGIVLLLSLRFLTTVMSPEELPVNFLSFAYLTVIVAVTILLLWKLCEGLTPRMQSWLSAFSVSFNKPQKTDVKSSPIIRNVVIKETTEKEKMPSEDTVHIESSLSSYIKRQFIYEATVVYIDVVDSTKLKQGEQHHNIIVSFTEYWRLVDDTFWNRQGRLLNRSGDGAAYVFKYADYAVLGAKEIFKRLDRFNKRINTLKSPFRVRIGLNTGRIIEDAARSSGDVFSSVIDIAAHLQKMAKPGQIVISANTYEKLRRTKGSFEFAGYSEKDQIEMYVLKK